MKKVDIIVSCFNEEGNILPFYNEIKKYLNSDSYKFNIIFVNDGSVDKTYERIFELQEANNNNKDKLFDVSVISFIHNFGHEAAMCAGIDYSKADFMIVMDVDLQNPPDRIPYILKAYESGADCVLLKRINYNAATLLKKLTSRGYYLFSKYILQNKNERDVSDFFALDKSVAKNVKEKYRTTLRFVRSFVQLESKNIKIVNYDNGKRFSGNSKYNYRILLRLALISELSRFKFFRNMYRVTKDNPIYIVDNERTKLL